MRRKQHKKLVKKLKPKQLIPETLARKEYLDTHCPFRTCYVCDRERRDLQMITPNKYRCDSCYPGSGNWLEYIERMPKKQRTEEQQIIFNHAKGIKP